MDAAHHFDMPRNPSRADCARMIALEWNLLWSRSQGEFAPSASCT